MKLKSIVSTGAMAIALAFAGSAVAGSHGGKPVGITKDVMSVTINHNGEAVAITRNQDNGALVNPAYAKTSRPCPPFCIQPIVLAPGVETLGESELLDYASKMNAGDKSIIVIDSRAPAHIKHGGGTIPGAINVPFTRLIAGKDDEDIPGTMEFFGAKETDTGLWSFADAKTLVMFCNGMWCGQSPTNIKTLLKFGYPADKIKWYRGGMQNWNNLGLTMVKP